MKADELSNTYIPFNQDRTCRLYGYLFTYKYKLLQLAGRYCYKNDLLRLHVCHLINVYFKRHKEIV